MKTNEPSKIVSYQTADECLKLVEPNNDADAWLRGESVDVEVWR